MKTIFFNRHAQLRNGWWILLFIALIAISRLLYGPTRSGLSALGVSELGAEPLSFLFILAITWLCCRLRGQHLRDVGLKLNGRWWRQLQAGLLFSTVQISVIVGVIWLAGGVEFTLNPQRSIQAVTMGFYLFLCAALMEELLFRGFIFQRLLDGIGIWPAQISMALLFAIGHWSNPDMEGPALLWATLDIGLGAILWGLAYIRTGSLALPIGMHLGWNWILGSGFGMAVSGHDHPGWLQPILQDAPAWLTGGDFGPEATIVAVIVDLIAILLLWRWKGDEVPSSRLEPVAVK